MTVDLPKRPPNHELATKAERSFAARLPPSWTIEWIRSDYGLDALLTPFANGNPTGDLIGVQIKGTRTDGRSALSVPIASSTLNYFSIVKHPVWLIVFDEGTDTCYWADLQKELIMITRSRGVAWRDQATVTIRIERERIVESSVFEPLGTGPSQTQAELDVVQSNRAREILMAALDLLSSGVFDGLSARINECLEETSVQTTKAEVEGLLLAGAIARMKDGQVVLSDPSPAGILTLLDLGGIRALVWLVKLEWQDNAYAETLGKLVAFAAVKNATSVAIIDELWTASPEAYLWAVQHFMHMAPSQCALLSGAHVTTTTLALSDQAPPSGRQHELRFTDPQKRTAWEARLAQESGPFLELVAADGLGYVVEVHPLVASAPGDARLISIEGVNQGKGMNVGMRSGEKPQHIRAASVWAILEKDDPLATTFIARPMIGFAQPLLDGKPFVVSGPQETIVSSDGTTKRMSVDGVAIFDQRDGMKPHTMPKEMTGRLRLVLRASKANAETTGLCFVKPNMKGPVPSSVMAVLRTRYSIVDGA